MLAYLEVLFSLMHVRCAFVSIHLLVLPPPVVFRPSFSWSFGFAGDCVGCRTVFAPVAWIPVTNRLSPPTHPPTYPPTSPATPVPAPLRSQGLLKAHSGAPLSSTFPAPNPARIRGCGPFCFTSTEARWLIRDGDNGGGGGGL